MRLIHPFRDFVDPDELFDGVNGLNAYCNKLESLAIKYANRMEPNLIKGNGFELFVEYLIKMSSNDNRIGISDYEPVDVSSDTGVDGKGTSTINGRPITVQAKYRQANHVLTNEDKLTNLLSASWGKYGVHIKDDKNMLIMSSAGSIHHFTESEMLQGKVRTLLREDLRHMTDNMVGFWSDFKASVIASQTPTADRQQIKLRQHQTEAIDVVVGLIASNVNKGIVELPTGTGKTYVQAAIINELIKKGMKTFAVFSPRILLSFQLLENVAEYLNGIGTEVEYLNVNSGRFDETEINEARKSSGMLVSQVKSTTSSLEIYEVYKRAQANNKPLVISSTYHSAEQLDEAKKLGFELDVQLNDEAHHMVSDEFGKFTSIGNFSYSFTATPKITEGGKKGYGMNNEEKFGKIIFRKTPREMIDAGEMLPPALHIVEALGESNKEAEVKVDAYDEITRCLMLTFARHEEWLFLKSKEPTKIGAKMLITVKDQKTLKGILNSKELQEFHKTRTDVHVMALSSNVGVYSDGWVIQGTSDDWMLPSRHKDPFLRNLQNLKEDDKAIILYVDMLTEGIDVPGITSFMPLRSMSDTGFKQGVGRSCRLQRDDRKALYEGSLKPEQHVRFVKPYAAIVIPRVLIESKDYTERYKDLLYTLVDEYGLDKEMIRIDDMFGAKDEEPKGQNSLTRRLKTSKMEVEKYFQEVKDDLDRPLEIHELAVFDLLNLFIADPDAKDKVFGKIKTWFKDGLKEYDDRAWRRYKRDEDYLKTIDKARKAKRGVFSDDCRKKYGTIYTPEFVVKETVDLAFKYLPKDVDILNLTYCDPASGDGNFLIFLYHKLMREGTSIVDPIERSYHILTHCLHGIEILEPMYYACKIRLVTAHFETVLKHGGDCTKYVDLMDNWSPTNNGKVLNIHWGNTICMPDDTKEEWYQQPVIKKTIKCSANNKDKEGKDVDVEIGRPENEGGLLPEEIRNKKYDMIVGNPPYTRFIGYKYSEYKEQMDFAQIFVLWSLNHLDNGICALNISDVWLLNKLAEGAKQTRLLICGKIREIVSNSKIISYSMNGGGDLPTTVVCLNNVIENKLIYNDKEYQYSESDLLQQRFIDKLTDDWKPSFNFKTMNDYGTVQVSGRGNRDGQHKLNSGAYFDLGGENFYIARSEFVYIRSSNNIDVLFKIIKCNDLSIDVQKMCVGQGTGYMKHIGPMSKEKIIWLFGWLNSTMFRGKIQKFLKRKRIEKGGTNYQLINNIFKDAPVPDYDFYLNDRPERVKAYMEWIENNVRDKDNFLAGIDAEFERMIK